MRNLYIFGAGETGLLVRHYFQLSGRSVQGFLVDTERPLASVDGLPVLAWEQFVQETSPHDAEVFVAISYQSMNKLRRSKFQKVRDAGFTMPTYVHPSANIASDVLLGENCLVLENCVVQMGGCLGDNVHVWSGSHVGHGATVGSHAFISSQVVLAGHSTIGAESFLGANSSVREAVVLGESCLVGIGAVALRSLPDRSNVVHTGSLEIKADDPRSKIVRRSVEEG